MAHIEVRVKIKDVHEWERFAGKKHELVDFMYSMKMAIYERCGVDLDKIEIEASYES